MRQSRTTSNVNRVPDIAVMIAPMHRTASSLVAQILEALGINMGDRQLGPNQFNPRGHTEDVDFFHLNVKILNAAGGDWLHPPYPIRIEQAFEWFIPRMRYILAWKQKHYHKWGFKDPRNCLTGRLIWPYLPDPKLLVVTERDRVDIADSLDRRARAVGYPPEEELEAKPTLWTRLIHDYEQARKPLIQMAGDDVVYVKAENLWAGPTQAMEEIDKLVARVGGNPVAALQRIKFRRQDA